MIRDSQGYNLVEVLVAMLIIGITTPLLMGSVIGSLTRTRESQGRSAATIWVQGEVESLRRQCYGDLLQDIGSVYPRKVTAATNRQGGEPILPATLEGRDSVAPDAGYVQVVKLEPALLPLLQITVSYYASDWGSEVVPPAPGDVVATGYIAEVFSGRCPP